LHPLDGNSWYHLCLGIALMVPLYLTTRRRLRHLCVLSVLLIPILLECAQAFMPSRTCDLTDILVAYSGSLFILTLLPTRKGR